MTSFPPVFAIQVLPGALAVCRLAPSAPDPDWAQGGGVQAGALSARVRTAEELSVVCAQELVPPGVQADIGWRALKVTGPLDFTLVGVLAGLARPLADAGVSIFAISTYDTDYVLVKEIDLERAIQALLGAGYEVRR
jgi:hypothetical protein